MFSVAPVFETPINIDKTNNSTSILDLDKSISIENNSINDTVDSLQTSVKQTTYICGPSFNTLMAYNNNYENVASNKLNGNYGLCHHHNY